VFENGASLRDSKTIKHGTVANASYIFQSLFVRQSKVISIVTLVLVVICIWLFTLSLLKRRARKKLWHQTHVASSQQPVFDTSKAGAQAVFHEETMFETVWRWKWLIIALSVFSVLLLASTSYIAGFFTVDGVSMYPTLQDRSVHPIIKLPRTLARVNDSEYVPNRGDIVVVHKDENNVFAETGEDEKSYVVKRVVGLPGDRVVVKGGVITIYNKEFKEGFVPDERYKWVKDLTGSEDFIIDITLKDSELFVVGDNRDESIDSRFYGPVNTKEVIGRVVYK